MNCLRPALTAFAALACAALAASPVLGGQYIYPTKGQTKAQQKKDAHECSLWAMDETGYDPANAPPPVAVAAGSAAAPATTTVGASTSPSPSRVSALLGALGGTAGAAPAGAGLGSLAGLSGLIPGGGGSSKTAMALQAATVLTPVIAQQVQRQGAPPAVPTAATAVPPLPAVVDPVRAEFDKARAVCMNARGYHVG